MVIRSKDKKDNKEFITDFIKKLYEQQVQIYPNYFDSKVDLTRILDILNVKVD